MQESRGGMRDRRVEGEVQESRGGMRDRIVEGEVQESRRRKASSCGGSG